MKLNILIRMIAALPYLLAFSGSAQDTMMYRGGFADGYSSLVYQVFYPNSLALSGHHAYKGGTGDGYAHTGFTMFYPGALTQAVMYTGGSGDGYSQLFLQQFYPRALTHSVMYTGGPGDGYSTEYKGNFQPGFLSHFAPYTIDTALRGDGYASSGHVDFLPEQLDHYVMYNGGEGDGYAGHLAVSYHPLPVGLISFTGEMVNNSYSLLRWTIAHEKDADHYELQRSPDSRGFITLYRQQVKTASVMEVTYPYEDHQPIRGANYYRLLIHEKSGSVKSSNTVLLFYHGESGSLAIFPNPASHSLNIQYQSPSEIEIRITDIKGTVLYKNNLASGSHTASIPVESFASGAYLLHLFYKDSRQSDAIRFIKQ